MDDERVKIFERELWTGGQEVYRQRVAGDCQMVLPAEPYVFTGDEAIASVSETPRWETVEFKDFRISRPQEGLIAIAYHVRAATGDEHYSAYCSSTYRRREHEEWEVIQHQQTVQPSA